MRDSQRSDGAFPHIAPYAWGVGHGAAAWADAGVILPWNVYLMTGDKQIIRDNWTAMENYMNFLSTKTEGSYKYNGGETTYGDWVAYVETDSRYCILGNALSIPDNDEEVLPPYRWYLTIDDLGNQLNKVRLRFVSGTTGIDETNFFDDDESIGTKKVYDLSGRRVNAAPDARLSSLPKGIYIINNRKYIVK